MGFVQSVSKGYQMLQLILSFMPVSIQTLLQLVFAFIVIGSLVSVIRFFLRGGGDS